MSLSSVLVLTIVTTAIWYVIYRVPLAKRQRANRFALSLATATSLRPDLASAIFGTISYVILGTTGLVLIAELVDLSIFDLFVSGLNIELLAMTALSLVGSMSWVSIGVGVFMAICPTIDLQASVRSVRWLAAIEAFPLRMRFSVPMLAALIEETYFRGAVYAAITATGGSIVLAFSITTMLFTAGQVLFCDDWVAAAVIGFTSLVISTFGTILVASHGNVVPALVVHMSFAGFYSGRSFYSDVSKSRG